MINFNNTFKLIFDPKNFASLFLDELKEIGEVFSLIPLIFFAF